MILSGINKSDQTAFGWQHSTHRLITERLVKAHNKNLPAHAWFNTDILKYSCVEPDFSRKNITKYIHGHFADIDKPSYEPPDAFALATRYASKTIESHQKGDYGKRDDYLGYALHFIQDMLNPKHVVFESVPKDHPERIEHKKFEQVAEAIQKEVLGKTPISTQGMAMPFFEVTLPAAMRETKKLYYRIKNKDYNDLAEIAAISLKNTYRTTNEFLKKLTAEMTGNSTNGMPRVRQPELFTEEMLSA